MQTQERQSLSDTRSLLAFLLVASVALQTSVGLGQSVPQYAFTIDSSQIPAGLYPDSLALDPSGNLYVSSGSTIIKLAANGTYLATWGTNGMGPGQFAYPGPMSFDSKTNLFVSDPYNNRIEKWDPTGQFLQDWGSYGTGAGQFDYPEGVAVDNEDRFYVADSNNNRIQVFTGEGVWLKQFGTLGTNAGQFGGPWVLAVDSSNTLSVVDLPDGFLNFRVQKFQSDGTFLTQWAAAGSNSQTFIQITGIATDTGNNVYVVDGANNRIQKFASDGTFIGEWGTFGTGPGEFNDPSGIAIDSSGNYVYVSDYYNRRIEVFAYSALAPIIDHQPTNETVAAGSSVSLEVGAFGAAPLAYQWTFNGTNLAGATGPTLTLSNAPLSATGSYAVIVTNSLGVAVSANATLVVLPVVVTTLPASSITSTSAVVNGAVSTGTNPSVAWFEWGTSTNYGNITGTTNLTANAAFALQQTLTGFSGLYTNHYRIVASNVLGLVYGEDLSFRLGLKPSLSNMLTATVNSNSVILRALINPNGRDTQWFFRWGLSSPYTYYTATNGAGHGIDPVAIQTQITGLQPGLVYHAQAVGMNDMGAGLTDITFIAPPLSLVSTLPQLWWSNMVASADGTELAVGGYGNALFVSTNSGAKFSSNVLSGTSWQALNMSADGTRIIAVASAFSGRSGPAYVSTNRGTTWNRTPGLEHNWVALVGSGDGLSLAGIDNAVHEILTSTNGGFSWSTNSPPMPAQWSALACATDGQTLIASAGGLGSTNGPIFTSTNAGLFWISNSLPPDYWQTVASSADGQILFAGVGGRHTGPIYRSADGGASWNITGAPITNWARICVSADAKNLLAVLPQSRALFTSTNSGATWQEFLAPYANWSGLACTADGARFWSTAAQSILALETIPALELTAGSRSAQLEMSWIIPSVPFTLQRALDLGGGQWTNLTNTTTLDVNTLRYRISIPTIGTTGFYRLGTP